LDQLIKWLLKIDPNGARSTPVVVRKLLPSRLVEGLQLPQLQKLFLPVVVVGLAVLGQ
jgi:hypothetical protein